MSKIPKKNDAPIQNTPYLPVRTELFDLIRYMSGWTIKEFAHRIGVSPNTVYRNYTSIYGTEHIPNRYYWRLREVVPPEVMFSAIEQYSTMYAGVSDTTDNENIDNENIDNENIDNAVTVLRERIVGNNNTSNVLKEELLLLLDEIERQQP